MLGGVAPRTVLFSCEVSAIVGHGQNEEVKRTLGGVPWQMPDIRTWPQLSSDSE